MIDAEENRASSCGEVGEPEELRRFRHGDGVGFECFLASVHVLHKPAGPGSAPMLVGALLWSPPRDEPVLRSAETVLQPGMVFHFMPALWMDSWGLETTETILIGESGPAQALCSVERKLFIKD